MSDYVNLDNAFHKINKEKEGNADLPYLVKTYTVTGKQDFFDKEEFPRLENEESVDAYAKSIALKNRTKYFVKRGRYGRLYNPFGMYSEGTASKQLKHAGRPEWNFRESSKKVFFFYLNFLKTKNTAWLNNAERES